MIRSVAVNGSNLNQVQNANNVSLKINPTPINWQANSLAAGPRALFDKNYMHTAFLFFFLIFLVVGVALTALGFLERESRDGTPGKQTFKILGVLALILCIGFLIAACVIISDCMTSTIKYNGCSNDYNYDILNPSYSYSDSFYTVPDRGLTSSFHSDDAHDWPGNVSCNNGQQHKHTRACLSKQNQQMTNDGARSLQSRPVHSCPSCSCDAISAHPGVKHP